VAQALLPTLLVFAPLPVKVPIPSANWDTIFIGCAPHWRRAYSSRRLSGECGAAAALGFSKAVSG